MEKEKNKKIVVTANGPYQVSGNTPLNQAVMGCDGQGAAENWRDGKIYDTGDGDYYLCRCGKSEAKPFCDGNHTKSGFKGRERAGRPRYKDAAELMEGRVVNLLDDRSLCVGARFCDKGQGIWQEIRRIDDPHALRNIAEETCMCPGGRLTVVTKGGDMIEYELDQEISLVEDSFKDCKGPLWVKGGIPIENADGQPYETRNRVALCRCGQSSNMPYCDSAHYECPHMRGLD